jgi:hypothetical protein
MARMPSDGFDGKVIRVSDDAILYVNADMIELSKGLQAGKSGRG